MLVRIYTLLSCMVLLMTSCERVIDVHLNEAEKKYVIEGVISDQPGSCKVLITRTKNFDESNTFPGISGAVVTVADGAGPEVLLTETAAGVYENNTITGVVGHTYKLKVTIGSEVFTSSSVIPVKVIFDTVYIKENTIFDETVKLVNLEYKDPAGRGNYYRYIQTINGEKDKTIFVRDDELNDGRSLDIQLFTRNDDDDEDASKIKTGDQVKVEMMCVDAAVYKYFYSLDQGATGTNESASPANPVTNIKGGALGYFSAHTSQVKTITSP